MYVCIHTYIQCHTYIHVVTYIVTYIHTYIHTYDSTKLPNAIKFSASKNSLKFAPANESQLKL